MEIDIFHLLKASNNPLILFDRIIEWVRRHESTLTSNGISSLTKRKMLPKDLNQQNSHSKILTKLMVYNIRFLSSCTINLVTFSVKK